ncbi:hypothetical protein CAP35_14515 [Chitinophagaceae bacterium IBVUCB1]|nr:hypothetical protein CAP35_14515 [Chitinophagaceae bacterium IBVUCB1]
MNRLDRITAILIQLQSKKVVKAQEIAGRFGISLRTVYRDVASLEEAGVPIIGEAGVGYSIMDGYRLPPVMFTKEEAITFVTAEKFIDKMTDKATAQQYKAALYKIKAVLRSAEKGMLEDIEGAIHVFKRNANPPAGTGNHIFDILQSISQKKAVRIVYYTNHSEQINERLIEPVGIYYVNGYWHLVAWCHLRDGYRNFRLDRIEQLHKTDTSFTIATPTLEEYLHDFSGKHKMIEMAVVFDNSVVKYIKEQRLYYGYVSEEKKKDVTEMKFMVAHPEYIASWLLSFKSQATILYPQSMIDLMKNWVKELQTHYS